VCNRWARSEPGAGFSGGRSHRAARTRPAPQARLGVGDAARAETGIRPASTGYPKRPRPTRLAPRPRPGSSLLDVHRSARRRSLTCINPDGGGCRHRSSGWPERRYRARASNGKAGSARELSVSPRLGAAQVAAGSRGGTNCDCSLAWHFVATPYGEIAQPPNDPGCRTPANRGRLVALSASDENPDRGSIAPTLGLGRRDHPSEPGLRRVARIPPGCRHSARCHRQRRRSVLR
jgi:hypothetical protein